MIFDFLVVLMLVLLNGVLAMSELAVVSSRHSRLQAMAESGRKGARTALKLAEQPGHFLSAVQVGITLVGLIAGAFSGTTIAAPISEQLEKLGVPDHYSDFLAFAGVVTVVTYLSLVIGELVPKRLALRQPEAIAAIMAPSMSQLTRVTWPLVVVLEVSSRTVLRLLRAPTKKAPTVTGEEIRGLIEEAQSAGIVPPQAKTMMTGVMRFANRRVRAIMTLRHEVDWVDLDASDAYIHKQLKASPHSRLPVAKGSLDAVVGVIHTKNVLDRCLDGEPIELHSFIAEAPVVIDTVSAVQAMEVLRESGKHILLVVDEYGVFQGLITPSNILEVIAGAFPIPGEEPEPTAVQRDDGSWLLDGDLAVDEMAELIGTALPPKREYHTVAGLVLANAMRIPRMGEAFTYRGWRFEVVDMDGQRIDKVLAARVGDRRINDAH